MKGSSFHLPLKLRTRCIYCSGAAKNRRSCSHEITVMDVTRETARTSRANVEEYDDDYEYIKRSAEVTERTNDMRDGAGPKSFTSAILRRFFPWKSESEAVLEVLKFILKVKEEFESNPAEEKHTILAVDDEAYCPCRLSFTSDSRTTEGRHVVLHTLHHRSIQLMLLDSICGDCQTILLYDGKKHIFTRELLDSWVWDICSTGGNVWIHSFLGLREAQARKYRFTF